MEKFGEDINNYCSFFGLSRLDFIPAYTEFEAWFNSLDTAAIRTTEQEQNKLIEAKKQAKNERLLTEAIPMWRNFEVRELPHNIVSKYTLLRCNKSTQCVETSKGIKVPYSLALSLYSNIQAAIDKGGCNDCNVSVMQYQINTINKEYIIAGCHIITIEEIQACYTNIQATINA
jgi:hypothetical protein